MKCFEKDRNLLQRYYKIIKDQLCKAAIEKIGKKIDSRKHYIPYHTVTTPEKSTTKVWVVYNTSVKYEES